MMRLLLFHHHHRRLQQVLKSSSSSFLSTSRIRQRQQQRCSSSSYWTVSFSGAGHLLAYHLGVIKVLLEEKKEKHHRPNLHNNIGGVIGSSSGAIAACIMTLIPHRLNEFTDIFLNNRGLALSTFKTMLKEEEHEYNHQKKSIKSTNNNDKKIIKTTTTSQSQQRRPMNMMKLGIATTRCKDTSLKVFTFDINTSNNDDDNDAITTTATCDEILLVIEASCKIPLSFHPFDIINKNNKYFSYPNDEGILIDGEYYVDGGIAAPIPFLEEEEEEGGLDLDEGEGEGDPDVVVARNRHNIIVSPFSGGGGRGAWSLENTNIHNHPNNINNNNMLIEIRPKDNTFTLPGGDWKVGRSSTTTTTKSSTSTVAFHIRPSIQNLRAMITSVGLVNPGILEDWYKRGIDDAERKLSLLDCQF